MPKSVTISLKTNMSSMPSYFVHHVCSLINDILLHNLFYKQDLSFVFVCCWTKPKNKDKVYILLFLISIRFLYTFLQPSTFGGKKLHLMCNTGTYLKNIQIKIYFYCDIFGEF